MPDIKKIKLGNTTYDIVDGTHKNIIILEDYLTTIVTASIDRKDYVVSTSVVESRICHTEVSL